MTNPELRGLDAILALADNGQYLPGLLADNAALISELQSFSSAFGGVKASGKLALTIDYKIDRFGQIDLVIGHTVTRPKAPKSKATAWTGEDGSLTVANPNQMRMEIRDVTPGHREFRVPGSN